MKNSECLRVADQLRRAFNGDPWHGPPLSELLSGVTAEQAIARPLPSAHSIWELVVHSDLYVNGAVDAVQGTPLPRWYGTGQDWPEISDRSPQAWSEVTGTLFRNAERLADVVEQFGDDRLQSIVPGREYDFYYLFHGIVQHSLYHGGQIAILKNAVAVAR
ncbi:MAG TPA: DinB family protein [Bryobacteraceae bacterium]|nr:DinB family protein [Bryobacteraceae bacterium]